ncbi:MAG: hypothetical protein ISQ13_02960 [Candidatus Margulisbacteria bacterium]|nr:hypothetical protein [Candidatus Margulisiibacteriota bacterium]
MITRLILALLLIMGVSYANEAPEFPEPQQYLSDRFSAPGPIGHVFMPRGVMDDSRPSIAFAHQNREWGYDWFLLAMVFPGDWGHVSFGYSNYSTTSLPVTKRDNVGIYLNGNVSDTFEIMAVSYQPAFDDIQLQFILNYKYRQLVTIDPKKAIALDAHISAKSFLNNQAGLRIVNLLATPYENKDSSHELPKYIGAYYWLPLSVATVFLEANLCTNYHYLSTLVGQVVVDMDEYLSFLMTLTASDSFFSFGLGTQVTLTDYFQLMYMHHLEESGAIDLSVHSISIGVTF